MLKKLRKFTKSISLTLLLTLLFQIVYPTTSWAITGGTIQPEFASFESANSTEMVNLFTGDFKYNIPLLDVGGYPVNIFYDANVSMEQDASWVGLGWNINAGNLTRGLRGLPDDLNGEEVEQEFYMNDVNKGSSQGIRVSFGVGGTIPVPSVPGLSVSGSTKTRIEFTAGTLENSNFKENSIQGSFYYGVERSVGVFYGYGGVGVGASASGDMSLSLDYNGYTGMGVAMGASVSAGVSVGFQKGPMSAGASASATASGSIAMQSRKGLVGVSASTGYNISANVELPVGSLPPSYGKLGVSSGASKEHQLKIGNRSYMPSIRNSILQTGNDVKKMYFLSTNIGFDMPSVSSFSISGEFNFISNNDFNNTSQFAENKKSVRAYGNYYAQNARKSNAHDVLQDFNRINDAGSIDEKMTQLPLSVQTYDMFSVTGQGIGLAFNTSRTDIGSVYDNYSYTKSSAAGVKRNEDADGLSIDLDFKSIFKRRDNLKHIGIGIEMNTVRGSTNYDGRSTYWSNNEGNVATDLFDFTSEDAAILNYEPAFYKPSGITMYSTNYWDDYRFIDEAIALEISNTDDGFKLNNRLKVYNSKNKTTINKVVSKQKKVENRVKRSALVEHLNMNEAQIYSLTKGQIEHYDQNSNLNTTKGMFNPTQKYKYSSGDQVTEFSILNESGSRYHYGLPVMSSNEREVMHSLPTDVTYKMDKISATLPDNVNKNNLKYYTSKKLPKYVSNYLLTAITTPDYVDVSNDGLSVDDLGDFTKFNYSKKESYKWRSGYGSDGNAMYLPNAYSSKIDDMVAYSEGERDQFYLHSIETKEFIAKFITDFTSRADGKDFSNDLTKKNVGKLIRIELYAKSDLNKPIKVVHFKYNTSLCKGIPNNTSGKLTLEAIYFSTGQSKELSFHPYLFEYNESPTYSSKNVDRWGNYTSTPSSNPREFSYTSQDKAQVDEDVKAWTLKKVTLPSGGTISVDYESDDYRYANDKLVNQMYKITNASGQRSKYLDLYQENFITVSLNESNVTNDMLRSSLKKLPYSNGKYWMYFKGYIYLKDISSKELMNYYVPIEIDKCFINTDGDAVIAVERKQLGDKRIADATNREPSVSYLSLLAMQQGRNNFSEQVYGIGSDWKDAFNEFVAFFKGINKRLYDMRVGRYLSIDESFVRLPLLEQKKLGGGKRVKSITYNDSWGEFTNDESSLAVTQSYEYGTGVVNYEPHTGGDDIARTPYFTTESHPLAPDDLNYQESPYGDELFPSGVVGYKDVTVKNVYDSDAETINKPGKTEYHFYTTYDFPNYAYSTEMQKELPKLDVYSKTNGKEFLGTQQSNNFDFNISVAAMSQGYLIRTNDMHGKLKEIKQYDSQGRLVAGERYNYKVSNQNSKLLDNQVPLLNNNNEILTEQNLLSVEVDVTNDSRSMEDKSYTTTSSHNQYIGMGNIIEVAVDIVAQAASTFVTGKDFDWSEIGSVTKNTSYHTMIKDFKSNVITKVVTQTGILVSTESYDVVQNTKVVTENLLWDAETGAVLLTKINNQFYNLNALNREGSEVYQFTYPAHWVGNEYGGAYQNYGIVFTGQMIHDQLIQTNPIKDSQFKFLFPGDELLAIDSNGSPVKNSDGSPLRFWVISDESTGDLRLIDDEGVKISDISLGYRYKVMRSGAANMLSESVGGIVSLTNPLIGFNPTVGLQFTNVLESHAQTYTDKAQLPLADDLSETSYDFTLSPFGNEVKSFFTGLLTDLTILNSINFNSELYYNSIYPSGNKSVNLSSLPQDNPPCNETDVFRNAFNRDICFNTNGIYSIIRKLDNAPILNSHLIMFPTDEGIQRNKTCNYAKSAFISEMINEKERGVLKFYINGFIPIQSFGNDPNAQEGGNPGPDNPTDPTNPSLNCNDFDDRWSEIMQFNFPSSIALKDFITYLKQTVYNDPQVEVKILPPTPRVGELPNLNNFIIQVGEKKIKVVFDPIFLNNYKIWDAIATKKPLTKLCSKSIGDIANPYKYGIRGKWHGDKSYVYNKAKRTKAKLNNALNGTYTSFVPFWNYDATKKQWVSSPQNYLESGETTVFDQNGHIRETKNLNNIYEAVLMGYKQRLPIARASNAQLHDILFETFEDYESENCSRQGLNFGTVYISDKESHTGRYSLRLENNDYIARRPMRGTSVGQTSLKTVPFEFSEKDKLFGFSPDKTTGKNYKLSYWQKTKSKSNSVWKTNSSHSGNLEFKIMAGTKNLITKIVRGNVIDGWQKVDVYFATTGIDSQSNQIDFFWNTGKGLDESLDEHLSDDVFYLDDIRIQPIGSSMSASVYDPMTYRKMADFDDNNYALFYEYDVNGAMTRIKRETNKGIVTIKESRSGLHRKKLYE